MENVAFDKSAAYANDRPGRARLISRKELVYMGKVRTGWSRTVSSQIRKQLDTVVSPKSRLTKPIRKPKATWVEPSFVGGRGVPGHHIRGIAASKLV